MRATLDVIGRVAFDINFKAVDSFAAGAAHDEGNKLPEEQQIFTVIRRSMDVSALLAQL
jgi:hypothetical protein